jgi:hypothetical protein
MCTHCNKREGVTNYKCSIHRILFCSAECFMKHLFRHWNNEDEVVGMFDIVEYEEK